MKGDEFIRKARKWAKQNGRAFEIEPQRGKGGHQMVKMSPDGITTVKTGEIGKGLKAQMFKQLGLPPDAF